MKTYSAHRRVRHGDDPQFNLTAMIDVVFLLIIFFMLICQFIVSENYQLVLPDACANAVTPDRLDEQAVTVSVFSGDAEAGSVCFAVRSEAFDPAGAAYAARPGRLLEDMTEAIGRETAKKGGELIHLRAEKDLTYEQVQTALLALANSGVKRVQLAAFRSRQDNGAEVGP